MLTDFLSSLLFFNLLSVYHQIQAYTMSSVCFLKLSRARNLPVPISQTFISNHGLSVLRCTKRERKPVSLNSNEMAQVPHNLQYSFSMYVFIFPTSCVSLYFEAFFWYPILDLLVFEKKSLQYCSFSNNHLYFSYRSSNLRLFGFLGFFFLHRFLDLVFFENWSFQCCPFCNNHVFKRQFLRAS